jgi:F plasmid transfer operon protein
LSRRALLGALSFLLFPAFASPAKAGEHPRIALIFVGASWCPVCHGAAAALAPAAARSELEVLVASQDGKPIPPWTDFVDARGNPLTAEVKALPTLLFVDLARGEVFSRLEGFQSPGQYLGSVRQTLLEAAEAGYG